MIDYVVVDENGNPIKRTFKEKVSDKFKRASEWIKSNKELTAAIVSVGGSAIVATTKVVARAITTKKNSDLKNKYCYDPSMGHYWKLKRKLTNKEWIEVESRKENGEPLGYILCSLGVLK